MPQFDPFKPAFNKQRTAIGWCFDSVKITGKLVPFSNWLRAQDFEPVWITRERETQVALLAHGYMAHSIVAFAENDFLARYAASGDFDLDGISKYDRRSARKLIEFKSLNDDYYSHLARFAVGFWHFLIEHYRPSLSLNLNGHPAISKALTETCRQLQIPQLFWENGLLPNTLVLDEQGVNYGAHLSGSGWATIRPQAIEADVQQHVENYRRELVGSGETLVQHGQKKGKQQIRKELGISNQQVLLVPLQVDSDSNVQVYSPLFKTMHDFVKAIVESAGGNENWIILFKEHPKRSLAQTEQVRSLMRANTRLITDYDLTSLFNVVDVTVCINSTVGLESLLRRIPTYAFGQSTYSEKGLTYDLYLESDPNEKLSELFSSDPRLPAEFDTRLATFLSYLLSKHLWATANDTFGSQDNFAQILEKKRGQPAENNPSSLYEETLRSVEHQLEDDQRLLERFRGLEQKPVRKIRLRNHRSTGIGKELIRNLQARFPQTTLEVTRGGLVGRVLESMRFLREDTLTVDFGRLPAKTNNLG